MKSILFYNQLLLIALYFSMNLISNEADGQMIINGDMEIGIEGTNTVPTDWTIVSGSPDHCESTTSSCPSIDYKIQIASPQGGKWVRFFYGNTILGLNNEVFAQQLSEPLITGKLYTIKFYTSYSKGNSSVNATTCNVIVGFSFGQPTEVGAFYRDTIYLSIPEYWVFHSYSFIATENYDFISFGKLEIDQNNSCYVDGVFMEYTDVDITIEIPNIFTPNADGTNDLFVSKNNIGITSMKTIIYNRWGKKVYETNNPLIEWDGRINGDKASEGVYFWVISYTDIYGVDKQVKGSVTLTR